MAKSESNSLAESLAALARSHRLRRVPLDWLWDAYLKKHTEIDPLERRRSFLEALREWAHAGGCRLPQRKKDWRHDAVPALPIWIDYMRVALKDTPIAANDPPDGMVQATLNGVTEWVKVEDMDRIQDYDLYGPEDAVPDEEAFDIF